MQTKDQVYLPRRSLLRGAGGVLLGSATLVASATSAAGFKSMPARPALSRAKPRVVAYQSADEPGDLSFRPLRAMDWVASQVGAVDLIAFHAQSHAVSSEDMVAISSKAAALSCYVALGVQTANASASDLVLMGPDGSVVAYGPELESVTCDTDVGRIALTTTVNPIFEQVGRGIDLVIHSGDGEYQCKQRGSYVVALTASASGTGSTIYASDNASITRSGAGWTQGIVATIDVAGLRRQREKETGSYA